MKFLQHLPESSYPKVNSFLSGYFYSDAGAAMGVLPKAIWQKKIEVDSANRMKTALRHLLIQTNDKTVLIDSGIGNTYSEKEQKIFKPTKYQMIEELHKMGVSRFDIDFVVFTHLHFDHFGGVVANIDGKIEITFPNAVHVVQADEWQTALEPDELNKAAYNLQSSLKILQEKGEVYLFDEKFNLDESIEIFKVGGHSVGSTAVMLNVDKQKWCFAGDIIANSYMLSLPITSAYDVSRIQTYQAKKKIIHEADLIVFNHDSENVAVIL